jgi:chitodextrinase
LIKIGRGALPSVTGTHLVASVRFKALAAAGKAAINFATGTEVISARSHNNIITSKSGSSVTLKPSRLTSTLGDTNKTRDSLAPKLSNVHTRYISTRTVIVAWTSSEPSTSEVNFGLTRTYGLVAVDSNLVTDHAVTLTFPNVSPNTTYHYTVKSADASGNESTSGDNTFTTKGLTLIATVVDKNNQRVKGAKVSFGNSSAITNANGMATVKGLGIGRQNGTIDYKHGKTNISANLSFWSSDKPQIATFKIDPPLVSINPALIPLAVVIALGVVIAKNETLSSSLLGLPAAVKKRRNS